MRKLKWLFFLSKRLYKKWTFLLLICLIPLCVGALRITASQRSGFVQIALVNLKGETGAAIRDRLTRDQGIIRFTEAEEAEAVAALQADRLDAVWVFPEDPESRFADYVRDPNGAHYLVRVIRKEDSLYTRIALEKLSAAIYPYTSRLFFLKCVREDPDLDLAALSDGEIYRYYDSFFGEGELFQFVFPESGHTVRESESNYVTSPVRGLLSVLVLLAGMAAAMLYISDEKKGVFAFVKTANRTALSFVFQLTAILNIGAFVFVSVFLLGVHTAFWREAAIFAIFIVDTALFCTVLQQLIRPLAVFAPVMVLITVLDIFLCPIFFDFYLQKAPQLLLPNTYYINAVHSNTYLKYSLIYTAVLAAVVLAFHLKKRRE